MSSEQDQVVLRRVHFHRNRRKLFQNVIGYLQGIIASGRVTADELAALHVTVRDAAEVNPDPDLIDLGYATQRLVDQAEVGDADEADLRNLIDCVLEYRTPDEASETSALEELLGLCSGIVADGIVTDEEAVALRNWLDQHPFAEIEWPVTDLVARLERIFADGRIDEAERSELRDALSNLVGGNFVETGSSSLQLPAELVEHLAHEIKLTGRTLCLTGEFFFGSRRQCILGRPSQVFYI